MLYSSFFQSVCVIGYCLFPLVVVAMIAIFVETVWFRVPGALIAFGWSTYASVGFLSESKAHLSNRRALAVSIKCQNSMYRINLLFDRCTLSFSFISLLLGWLLCHKDTIIIKYLYYIIKLYQKIIISCRK